MSQCHNNKNTDGKKKAFLGTLCDGYSISYAAHAAGINRRTVYRWRDGDMRFGEAWDDAYEQGTDWYEDKLREAADSLNPTMIMAALNARRSTKYRYTSKLEVSGTVKHAHHDLSRFSDKELDSLLELAKRYSSGEGAAETS